MASDPHAPKHPQMREILKDQALSKTSRLCAVELYYHTDWKSGRMICGAEPAAHLRRHLDLSESAARRSVRQLKDQGYIEGCFFNPSPFTSAPPVITDTPLITSHPPLTYTPATPSPPPPYLPPSPSHRPQGLTGPPTPPPRRHSGVSCYHRLP